MGGDRVIPWGAYRPAAEARVEWKMRGRRGGENDGAADQLILSMHCEYSWLRCFGKFGWIVQDVDDIFSFDKT